MKMKRYGRYFGNVVIATDGEYEYATVFDYTLDATKAMENEGWKLTGTYYTELTFERMVFRVHRDNNGASAL